MAELRRTFEFRCVGKMRNSRSGLALVGLLVKIGFQIEEAKVYKELLMTCLSQMVRDCALI